MRNLKKPAWASKQGMLELATLRYVYMTEHYMTEGQCLASYSRDPGKFSMFFSMVFQASKGKIIREEKARNISRDLKI